MKKKIYVLLFAMLICLFSLTGCTQTQTKVTDEDTVSFLTQKAQELIGEADKYSVDDEAGDEELNQKIEEYGIDGMYPDSGKLSGYTSWKNNREDLGEFESFNGVEVTYDESEKRYTVVYELSFEKRDCEYKLIVDRNLDEFEIISQTFNPEFTFGEKMGKAALNTLMGIGTVFIMLILISLIISCFKYINVWETNKKKQEEQAAAAAAPAAPVIAPAEEAEEEEDLTDDLELVAVITAAIAASEETSADGLIVRSIRRRGSNQWKRA